MMVSQFGAIWVTMILCFLMLCCRSMPTVLSLVAVKHLVEGSVTVSERQTDISVTVRLSHVFVKYYTDVKLSPIQHFVYHISRDLQSFEIRIGWFRFDSKVTDWFEIFESAASAVVPQTTLTVQQKKPNHCVIVIEIYFMFIILCLCSKSIHTH